MSISFYLIASRDATCSMSNGCDPVTSITGPLFYAVRLPGRGGITFPLRYTTTHVYSVSSYIRKCTRSVTSMYIFIRYHISIYLIIYIYRCYRSLGRCPYPVQVIAQS